MRGPVLERYQIVGELGQGGMSVVYRARDKQLSRDVAVKVLHEFLARQPDARKRFHREAVAVAKLHHPGILEIFDYSGPEAADTYIVTELIEGETLRDFVDRRGRVEYPEIGAMIVSELVRALRHAHEQSVIHRDLKPENVMLTKDGVLKLMDFGLAQLMDGGTKLTATGTLLGSPAHMAPEVIDGNASDARADIFSMGTILFWLTTGKLPFEAQNPSALFKKILDGRYEHPQVLEPKIGNGLARILQRALEPDPEQRYQDVTELGADLQTELEQVQLEPAETNVKRYFRDPDGFARELGPKLVATLAASGKAALRENNVARAMDRFNRVLAIDADHHEVRALVARLGRRKELARRAKQLATAAGAGLIAAGAAYGGVLVYPSVVRALESPPPPREAPRVERLREAEVAVPTVKAATIAASGRSQEPSGDLPEVEAKPVRAVESRPRVARATIVRPAADATRARVDETSPEVGPTDQTGSETPTLSVTEEKRPVLTKVKVIVGRGIATHIIVDGKSRPFNPNAYDETLELGSGRHAIAVENERGRSSTHVVEVDDTGAVVELGPDGTRIPLPPSGLRLAAPN